MTTHHIGIIMNGVTGRIGSTQHLARSIAAIRADGGVLLDDGSTIMPEPLLVGRNEEKLRALSKEHGELPYRTLDAGLETILADDEYPIYFDCQATAHRCEGVKQAIAAGKHVYCEKPSGTDTVSALELYLYARPALVKHGVVQDKLFLPGIRKLGRAIESGVLGDVLSVRGEFGYWVFPDAQPVQRPSWNFRKAQDGGIMLDMHCHWRYLIDNLIGNVASVSCIGANHIKRRMDEAGEWYDADADDAAYATFVTETGVICQFNASFCTRVRRDDLLTIQVDGTEGSAVAGLRECFVQDASSTPRVAWDPDRADTADYFKDWERMPDIEPAVNPFRAQWERFLRHVVYEEPFPWDLLEGAKGVQLGHLSMVSWEERAWVDIPPLA